MMISKITKIQRNIVPVFIYMDTSYQKDIKHIKKI